MKPVCIILRGPSVYLLEQNIELFGKLDVIWAGMNDFDMTEPLLGKINKKYEFVFVSCRGQVDGHMEDIIKFKNRNGVTLFSMKETIADKEVMRGSFISDNPEEALGLPSILYYLNCLEKFGARDVFVFGMDGYKGVYGNRPYDLESIQRDVGFINTRHREFVKTMNVYNVSPDSVIESFPKITLKECLEMLNAKS